MKAGPGVGRLIQVCESWSGYRGTGPYIEELVWVQRYERGHLGMELLVLGC